MKFLSKKEAIVIIIILCVALIWLAIPFLHASDTVYAEIYHYSDLVHVVDLSKKEASVLNFDVAPNVYITTTEKGEIYFSDSDCPDKICIHSGILSITGHTAACLPNGIMIKIVSGDSTSADIIV